MISEKCGKNWKPTECRESRRVRGNTQFWGLFKGLKRLSFSVDMGSAREEAGLGGKIGNIKSVIMAELGGIII